jgi:phosphohistidine phosphatase
VYHSEKKRAEDTALIIAEYVKAEKIIRREDLAPNDAVDGMVREVLSSRDDLLVVGHSPFLPRLASKLLCGSEKHYIADFQFSGLMCLEQIDREKWFIQWFIQPGIIV